METTVTDKPTRQYPHEVYFLRRALFIYLPVLIVAMAVYFVSFIFTVTANGLSVVAALVVGFVILLAALDGRDLP